MSINGNNNEEKFECVGKSLLSNLAATPDTFTQD